MTDWMLDKLHWFIGGLIVFLISGTVILVIAEDRADKRDKAACLTSGGNWVPDGPPTYIKIGTSYVPSQDYKCEGTN